MKIARVGDPGQEIGVVSGDGTDWYRLPDGADVIGPDGTNQARAVLHRAEPDELVDVTDMRFGAPVRPGKIVCAGLNYRRHAAEAGMPEPDQPILFLKAADTVVGPRDDVIVPSGSGATDYELELAVVIGRQVRDLGSRDEALAAILGYMVANDVSERDYQLERGGTWDKGKNCETFCPLGPWLVPAADIGDVQGLSMGLEVNGESRQRSSTGDMIFPVDALVRYISGFMTLYPGDVVLTGTPEGVGAGFDPVRFLAVGDLVTARIEGLGEQRFTMVDRAAGGVGGAS